MSETAQRGRLLDLGGGGSDEADYWIWAVGDLWIWAAAHEINI
jgi:hypothetical protein